MAGIDSAYPWSNLYSQKRSIKAEKFMRSLECAAQEKTELTLRGKGSKHIPKSDRKRGFLGTERITQNLPPLRKPLSWVKADMEARTCKDTGGRAIFLCKPFTFCWVSSIFKMSLLSVFFIWRIAFGLWKPFWSC